MSAKYQEYLASREWALKKTAIMTRSGGVCERCKRNAATQTHHKTYERIYNENLDDLVAVCQGCHEYISAKTDIDPAQYKQRVYLAGKVGGNKWKFAKELETDLYVYFISSDGSKHSEHLWGIGSYGFTDTGMKEWVAESVLENIDMSIGLVAYLDSPDSYGSISEICYASSVGKKCLVVLNLECDSKETGIDPPMHDAYWFISNFPNVETVFYDKNVKLYIKVSELFNISLRDTAIIP